MITDEKVIQQTKKWITDVVVGCNFCPFAAKEVKQQTINYEVQNSDDNAVCLNSFLPELFKLNDEQNIETTFLIFPNAFKNFDDYLDFVEEAEAILIANDFEGIYQVASFHPLYQFANTTKADAANFTNKSIYPMLHVLREASIDKALLNFKSPENIPTTNINFAREKGFAYMNLLRESCI